MSSKNLFLLILAMLTFAALPAAVPVNAAAASQATFVGTDNSTQGNWKGPYGSDGYVIANDAQKIPSYASFAVQNQTNYTWAAGTVDARALESGLNGGRIASTWYSNTSFNFDLNLIDGNAHQIALYAVDWDNYLGGRTESVQIVDAVTNAVLDTEKISAFNKGVYLIWKISGHVKINVAYTGGNAVISGVFFTSSSARFAGTDTSTQGNWKGVYGADGYTIANDAQKIPSYATFAVQNQTNYTWASGTSDARALESGLTSGRIASTWYSNASFNFDLNLTDGNAHRVALYAVDWDNYLGGRIESVQIVDANSNAVLDTEKISAFNNGIYLIWNISGHVKINVAYAGGGNAVTSGIFFGAGTGTATAKFAGTDSSTQGNWKSAYGSDGYAIANDSQNIPAYASFAVQNQTDYTWASNTTDVRALQSGVSTGRIASTWYSDTSFNFDLNLTDGNAHRIALYALDWDNYLGGRIESVQIVDAVSNAVLDTEKISAFNNGIYLIWNISGHVKINVAYSGGNAVISGVLFGAGPASANTGSGSLSSTGTPPPAATGTVVVNPASFSFGSVNVGSHVIQAFTVSNSGSGSITFSSVTIAGAGLSATGVSTGTTLSAGQSTTLTVTYAPASAGGLAGGVTFVSNASNPNVVLSLTGTGAQAPSSSSTINAVSFLGTDTTTQGAWKGIGKFNTSPPSSSFVYGKEGDILPDTEACDACNPFPSYVSFGPNGVNSSTPGYLGSHPYSTHASAELVQGPASVMGPEPSNTGNTNYYQCNYTYSNPAIPWAPMVAWTPAVDTREISSWYTCGGLSSFYLEFSFGNSTHNFEVYVVDDQSGGTLLRSEELQVLDGDTNAVLYDSGPFTNFTGGVYYKWSITGHVKVKVINTSTNGTVAVINGVFFN